MIWRVRLTRRTQNESCWELKKVCPTHCASAACSPSSFWSTANVSVWTVTCTPASPAAATTRRSTAGCVTTAAWPGETIRFQDSGESMRSQNGVRNTKSGETKNQARLSQLSIPGVRSDLEVRTLSCGYVLPQYFLVLFNSRVGIFGVICFSFTKLCHIRTLGYGIYL